MAEPPSGDTGPDAADRPRCPPPARGDVGPVEGVLKLLARAIRQFHTYPATSPICIEAVTACQDALSAVPLRDRLSFRVTPHDLMVDEAPIGAGSVIEHELTRRLFKARVATLDIDRAATPRDLSRFCIDLVGSDDLEREGITFAERLAEHGVSAITAGMAHRPAVLDVGNPAAPTRDVLDARAASAGKQLTKKDAPVSYMYPPDKGWVRLDPGQSLDTVSLVDLVVLVEDPADVASMLLRLTDDDIPGVDSRQTALERKFSDVTLLFSALDPRLAQVMFGRLARAVLKLDPDRRNNLLQRTILPGLLDGRDDGKVLRDFPDMDLAESICLLLDLETAAPEVLSAALNRLDITPDRRAAIAPLIDERLRAQRGEQPGDPLATASGIDRHAQGLIRVDSKRGTDFSEFAAWDLSVDEQSGRGRRGGSPGDRQHGRPGDAAAAASRSWCASSRTRRSSMRSCAARSSCSSTSSRPADGTISSPRSRDTTALAAELRERRPDVAEAIVKALSDFCTPSRLLALAERHDQDDEGRAIVEALTRALGPGARSRIRRARRSRGASGQGARVHAADVRAGAGRRRRAARRARVVRRRRGTGHRQGARIRRQRTRGRGRASGAAQRRAGRARSAAVARAHGHRVGRRTRGAPDSRRQRRSPRRGRGRALALPAGANGDAAARAAAVARVRHEAPADWRRG